MSFKNLKDKDSPLVRIIECHHCHTHKYAVPFYYIEDEMYMWKHVETTSRCCKHPDYHWV